MIPDEVDAINPDERRRVPVLMSLVEGALTLEGNSDKHEYSRRATVIPGRKSFNTILHEEETGAFPVKPTGARTAV
ncbi:hypothetical protein T265_11142 [Opisthorchis viverrini]|uniref:Uncharacterized protein n=1 Tax=Opisthorchis viverrini TaxID=6198 RepID=A0A074ZYL6_OPIVI|nr:hypothetical protein T265_11142 [Opisthorchis viverrini]KER20259.1 hypothetical protein T265_11142 [Opisthorchis viverrini]